MIILQKKNEKKGHLLNQSVKNGHYSTSLQ